MMNLRFIHISFFIITLAYLFQSFYPPFSFLPFVLKPCIVSTLIVIVCAEQSIGGPERKVLIIALLLPLLGDILLMVPGELFIGGLIAFLFAHIGYILLFSYRVRAIALNKRLLISSLILLLLYGSMFLHHLAPVLGNLLLPVIIYILAILLMTLMAINRYGQVSTKSHLFVMIGALLFIISDTLLAINKFYLPLPNAGFWIMSTYSFAQYFIVYGIIIEAKIISPAHAKHHD